MKYCAMQKSDWPGVLATLQQAGLAKYALREHAKFGGWLLVFFPDDAWDVIKSDPRLVRLPPANTNLKRLPAAIRAKLSAFISADSVTVADVFFDLFGRDIFG